ERIDVAAEVADARDATGHAAIGCARVPAGQSGEARGLLVLVAECDLHGAAGQLRNRAVHTGFDTEEIDIRVDQEYLVTDRGKGGIRGPIQPERVERGCRVAAGQRRSEIPGIQPAPGFRYLVVLAVTHQAIEEPVPRQPLLEARGQSPPRHVAGG